jgi:hypothetical protein
MPCPVYTLIPLSFILGIMTLLASYFNFRDIIAYAKRNKNINIVTMNTIFGGNEESIAIPNDKKREDYDAHEQVTN